MALKVRKSTPMLFATALYVRTYNLICSAFAAAGEIFDYATAASKTRNLPL